MAVLTSGLSATLPGNLPGGGFGGTAGDVDRDQVRGPFAIERNRAGQFARGGFEFDAELLQLGTGQRLRRRRRRWPRAARCRWCSCGRRR